MNKLQTFTKASFLSGLAVLLPITILVYFLHWILSIISGLIRPLTKFFDGKFNNIEIIADVIVLCSIIILCFIIGTAVRTRLGMWFHNTIENSVFKNAPGYMTIKEIVMQFIGIKKKPFSSVALAQVFGNDIMATVFITDEHPSGMVTVFMPTGPNPTSGLILHLDKKHVHIVKASVEETMRTIISCGAGSTKLIEAYISSAKQNT